MDNALVSVIMNCYNGERYLREAVDSVIEQTYVNWELIFWDNCSTDNSREIVLSYHDPRIKYFKSEVNAPLGEARNLAIKKSEGAYIGFLDTDDIWDANKLEVQVLKMQANAEIGIVHSNYLNFWEGGSLTANTKVIDSEESFQYLLSEYKIGMSVALLRKSVLEAFDIQFDNALSMIEDFDFFLQIAYHSKVWYCKEVLMRYRMHPDSLTNNSMDKWAKEFNYLLGKLKSFLSPEELHQYKKELDWIKIRAVNAEITGLLTSNDRVGAFKTILSNIQLSYKLALPVVGVIFGYKNYTKTLRFIRKRTYRHTNEI
jgi:glycosyltransferase involved in cell wall biosynthesis